MKYSLKNLFFQIFVYNFNINISNNFYGAHHFNLKTNMCLIYIFSTIIESFGTLGGNRHNGELLWQIDIDIRPIDKYYI